MRLWDSLSDSEKATNISSKRQIADLRKRLNQLDSDWILWGKSPENIMRQNQSIDPLQGDRDRDQNENEHQPNQHDLPW